MTHLKETLQFPGAVVKYLPVTRTIRIIAFKQPIVQESQFSIEHNAESLTQILLKSA